MRMSPTAAIIMMITQVQMTPHCIHRQFVICQRSRVTSRTIYASYLSISATGRSLFLRLKAPRNHPLLMLIKRNKMPLWELSEKLGLIQYRETPTSSVLMYCTRSSWLMTIHSSLKDESLLMAIRIQWIPSYEAIAACAHLLFCKSFWWSQRSTNGASSKLTL